MSARGWLCVVVPGGGLGWVYSAFIERIEREPLESCRSEQDGWYDVTFGVSEVLRHVEDLRPLLSTISCQLRFLTFDFTNAFDGISDLLRLTYPMFSTQTVTQMIAEHCINLEQLNLISASAVETFRLLGALNGELGRRILVLNLNESKECFNDASAARLATLLAKTKNPLALQELRLNGYRTSVQGLETFYDALLVNRTLALIELDGTEIYGEGLKRKREHLDAAFQGQLLQATATMERKLAFLSVVASDFQSEGNTATTALNTLDPSVLSLVFEFAASREVRRTIAWN